MPKRRTYLLAAAAAVAFMPPALAGGVGATPSGVYASTAPTSVPPSPSDESCAAPSAPAVLPVALARRVTGPVTCDDGTSTTTVSWDGVTIKIVITATKPKDGMCAIDPDSIVIGTPRPEGAKVNALGDITVPYDKEKREKITVKIRYTVICYIGGMRHDEIRRVDVEFTPPGGPVVIAAKPIPQTEE